MAPTTLFSPLTIGPYCLAHRVIMAPLTRMRAEPVSSAPHPLNVEYYTQRATKGGLIIAEATQVSPQGKGMPATPGIHSDAQMQGWRTVTDAVPAKGGIIFNGDGQPDILVQNSNGAIVDYLMNGATIVSGNDLGNPGPG